MPKRVKDSEYDSVTLIIKGARQRAGWYIQVMQELEQHRQGQKSRGLYPAPHRRESWENYLRRVARAIDEALKEQDRWGVIPLHYRDQVCVVFSKRRTDRSSEPEEVARVWVQSGRKQIF